MRMQGPEGRALCVDAHHHLWQYSSEEFAWIGEDSIPLRRDFAASDLIAAMDEASVDQAVAVQARESLQETRWLLANAAQHPRISAVVGWVPLTAKDLPHMLEEFCGSEKLAGFRDVAQDKPPGYFDQPDLNSGIKVLTGMDYSFDLLVRAHQLEEATRFVDRHPNQRFVLDHAAKPLIRAGLLEPWKTQLVALAKRDNVMCKLSGLVTEADWHTWTPATLQPYMDTCVEAFGPDRLLAGSDWPVCLLATTYRQWWTLLRQYFAAFTPDEQNAVFGLNAARAYTRSVDAGLPE